MNYKKTYDALIKKAQIRNSIKGQGIYLEKHHIIPRCMDGNNEFENLVNLTAKEHFVVHHLLTKIYGKKCYQAFAAFLMRYNKFQNRDYNISARLYKELRECAAIISSERQTNNNSMSKKVSAKNLLTGETLMVLKEDFDNDKNLVGVMYGVISKIKGIKKSKECNDKNSKKHINMVSAFNINTNKTCTVTKEEYNNYDYLVKRNRMLDLKTGIYKAMCPYEYQNIFWNNEKRFVGPLNKKFKNFKGVIKNE